MSEQELKPYKRQLSGALLTAAQELYKLGRSTEEDSKPIVEKLHELHAAIRELEKELEAKHGEFNKSRFEFFRMLEKDLGFPANASELKFSTSDEDVVFVERTEEAIENYMALQEVMAIEAEMNEGKCGDPTCPDCASSTLH